MTYSLVRRVNEDDFVVLVHTVLVDPVRVEHTKIPASTTDTLLRDRAKRALEFEVVHTLSDGLAKRRTLFTSSVSSIPLDVIRESKVKGKTHPWRRAFCGFHVGHGRGR